VLERVSSENALLIAQQRTHRQQQQQQQMNVVNVDAPTSSSCTPTHTHHPRCHVRLLTSVFELNSALNGKRISYHGGDIAKRNDMIPANGSLTGISMVQPPGECF